MRNFDCRIPARSAFLAALVIVALQAKTTFAQVGAYAFSSREGSATTKTGGAVGQPAATVAPVDQFQQLLDRAIDVTSKRYLTANAHSPWQIFHCVLAMRKECVLKLGNDKVNAIEWITTTEPQFDNQPWLMLTPHGAKFHPYTKKYYFEGHPSQFLALLSHSNLPLDYPFHVQGKVVTLNDLVNNTMKEVNTNEEVTWVLWALQHFLKSDAAWVNQANEPWSIERLVQIESGAPVVGAPCGGNHRLFALTRARDKYLRNGGKLRGVWFQADQKIRQHIEVARSLQNPDGSFSSEWYKGPGNTNDVNMRFNTTGHTMEFLAESLPTERLNEPWVRNAVWMLSRELIINQNTQIDCGPLFHSLDALIIYRDRIRPKVPTTPTVEQPDQLTERTSTAPILSQKPKAESIKVPASTAPIPETKSTPQPPVVAKVPADVKPSETRTQAVPIPIPEPSLISEPPSALEPQADEPKLESPNSAEPQTRLQKSDAVEPRRVVVKVPVPKIDPTQLANIGEVAPASKVAERKVVAQRVAQRDQIGAPNLLPESSATPLANSVVPDSRLKAQLSALDPGCEAAPTPTSSVSASSAPPEIPSSSAAEIHDMSDLGEPASALQPDNA